MAEKLKYYLFFGSDVAGNPGEILKRVTSDKYRLFPLDSNGIGFALEYNHNLYTTEDFFDQDELKEIRDTADKVTNTWFLGAKEGFTSSGICWPEFDRMALCWSWYDAVIILKLIDIFKRRDAEILINPIGNNIPRPSVFAFNPSDIVKTLLKASMDTGLIEMPLENPRPPEKKTKTCWELIKRNRSKTAGSAYKELLDKIICIVRAAEYVRIKDVVARLKKDFSERFVLGSTDVVNSLVMELSQGGFTVEVPSDLETNPSLPEQFLKAYRDSITGSAGESYINALRHLPFHFNYYCCERWPQLDRIYNFWFDLFRKYPPRAVLGSGGDIAEYQIPLQAATAAGIDSYSIPHGFSGRTRLYLVRAKNVLCCSKFRKLSYEASVNETNIDRVKIVRDLFIERVNKIDTDIHVDYSEKKKVILALLNLVGYYDLIHPWVLPRAQLNGLNILSEIPSSLSDKVQVLIRPRPGNLDIKILQNSKAAGLLVPPETSLEENIAHADLIVDLNNYGSSLIHAIRAKKPILFLLTDRAYIQWDNSGYSELYLELGEHTADGPGFWKAVNRFIEDPEYAGDLRMKTARFAEEYWNFEDKNHKNISQVIAGDLNIKIRG